MNFFRLIFPFIVALILTSCLTQSKLNKVITEHYSKTKLGNTKDSIKNEVICYFDTVSNSQEIADIEYKRFFMVPLVFYTYCEEKIECTINPKIFENHLFSEFKKIEQKDVLTEKLKGKRIELYIQNIPTTFNHSYKSHFIIFRILAVRYILRFTKNKLYSKENSLRLRYIIRDLESMEVVSEGKINQIIYSQFSNKQYKQSRKSFLDSYLYQIDSSIDYALEKSLKSILYTLY